MKKGFTLIEILLTTVMIGVVVAYSVQISLNFLKQNDVILSTMTLVMQLRKAQIHSLEQKNGGGWGVHVEPGTVTLFCGTTYASRTTDLDESLALPASIQISGLTDIVFSPFTGLPQTVGTYTFTSSTYVSNVSINTKGALTY